MMAYYVKNFVKRHENVEHYLRIFLFRMHSILAYFISDRAFIYAQYFLRTGKILNLRAPLLYNEKIQWYKLNYKEPLLTQCVDKWEVRDYVEKKGLGELLIPAYGPFVSPSDIDYNLLPEKFIMKLTNGSGFNIICGDKTSFDQSLAGKKFNKWIEVDFFSARREWAYKNVANRIMVEDLLTVGEYGLPNDTRFFCFNGEPKVIAIDLDSVENDVKTSNYYRHLFTPDWEEIDAKIQYPRKRSHKIEKPTNLGEMLNIAKVLSADFPAVRVDLYNLDGRIYFGELTFYHASGYQSIEPVSFELALGEFFKLPT